MEEGEDLLEEPGQLFSSRRAHSFKHRLPSWLLFDEGPLSAESMDSRGLVSFFFFLNGVLYINGHSIIHQWSIIVENAPEGDLFILFFFSYS